MGLDSILPFEGAGSAVKNLFAGANAATRSGSEKIETGQSGAKSGVSGFLSFLQKAAPDNAVDGLHVGDIGADGRFGVLPGIGFEGPGGFGGPGGSGGLTTPAVAPDLAGLDLAGPDLVGPDLVGTDLVGTDPDGLNGEFKNLAQGKNPIGVGPPIGPPLDGALPIAGDNAENGNRLFAPYGSAFDKYLANSSVGDGVRSVNSGTNSAFGEGLANILSPAGDAAQIDGNEPLRSGVNSPGSSSGSVKVVPPAVEFALDANRTPGGQGALSIGLEALEGVARSAPTLAGATLKPGLFDGIGLDGNSPPEDGGAQTSQLAGAAASGTANVRPPLGPHAHGVSIGGPSAQAGSGAVVAPQSIGLNPSFAGADPEEVQFIAGNSVGRGSSGGPQPGGSTAGTIAGAGPSGASTSDSSAQTVLKNGVSSAAQKFANSLADTKPTSAASNGQDAFAGLLPGDGSPGKVDNGFATFSPQNTPDSSTARSLSPAIVSAAAGIARGAAQGDKNFTIRLDPPELGRVDVQLKIGDDGIARAHLIVERPETLDLFLRDQRSLERSLEQAGVKTDGDSLQFSLEDGDQGTAFARSEDENQPRAGSTEQSADAESAVQDVPETRQHQGQLNITI